jgi:CelD/BcsL family acetyltransferase involved in cellulose biosynthesis
VSRDRDDGPGGPEPETPEILGSLEEAREDWTILAPRTRNIFGTWEWAATWWRHYGRSTPLVLVRRDQCEPVVLLPLYLWSRRPLRVARFIGHGPADQLGPICGPEKRAVAATVLSSVVSELRLNLVLAELLPGSERWPDLLGRRPALGEASPTISLDRGWDAYLAGRSANLRQQIRRRERQLRRRHTVRFRLAADHHHLQADMTSLFALHRARWGSAGSAFVRFEGFHRDFAQVALERGWLRLWFLELDGRPAAAWYGFRFAGVESYYQAGRDPLLGDESVGFVLLAHSIREAATDGMREYRLLRGSETFKLRFADADPGVQTFALGHGPAGRAAAWLAAAGVRSDTARAALRGFARTGS